MKLYEQIFTLRTAHGMSQGDLADALEVSRQSVSKWETGAAVPELDKLLRMSELFGVSLDELVKGEGAPLRTAAATPQAELAPAEPSPRPEISRTQRILGFCLLGFAALTWLLVTLLGDFLAGVCLALPFVVVGIICLKARRAGLVCCWLILFIVQGISLFLEGYLGTWVRRVSFGIFLALLATTLYLHKGQSHTITKRNIVILCVSVVGIILSCVTSALFTSSFFHEHLPFILMLILLYISCYAGQILFIFALLRAVAMVRYYKTK